MRREVVAAAVAILMLCSCNRPPSYISVNGSSLPAPEVYYCLAYAGAQIVEGEENFDWDGVYQDQPVRKYVRDQAVSLAVSYRAIEAKARQLGVVITPDEDAAIDRRIQQAAGEQDSREEFDAFVDDVYGSKEIYRYYGYAIPYLSEKLLEHLFKDDGEYAPGYQDLELFFQENYTNVSYILISASDQDGQALSGEERAVQKAVAEAIYRQAAGGEDFAGLIMEHGQDYSMSLSPEGMSIMKGSYEDIFEQTAESLKPGEISDVVEGEFGFYIIKRLEPDTSYLRDNEDSVREQYIAKKYTEMVAQWCSEMECKVTEAYNALDPKIYYRQI